MIENWWPSFDKLMILEGGYSNLWFDRGGPTNFGVTQATYDAWNSENGIPTRSVKEITKQEAVDIYWTWYWMKCRCNDLPAGLDFNLFQYAVVHGVGSAIRDLQRVLGVTVDGNIGPQTLAAIRAADQDKLNKDFADRQKSVLTWIAYNVTDQMKNYQGWMNRVSNTLSYIPGMIATAAKAIVQTAEQAAAATTQAAQSAAQAVGGAAESVASGIGLSDLLASMNLDFSGSYTNPDGTPLTEEQIAERQRRTGTFLILGGAAVTIFLLTRRSRN